MKITPTDSPLADSRRDSLVLMSLSTLYQYMYCMTVSSAFSSTPVFGGALFMCSRVATELARILLGEGRKDLPQGRRVTSIVLLVFMLLCTLLLLAVYPALLNAHAMWVLFAVALALTLRAEFCRRLTARFSRGAMRKFAFFVIFALFQLIPVGIMAALFFPFLPAAAAWQMLGGFALSSVLECYGLWREHKRFPQPAGESSLPPEALKTITDELREVNAYLSFARIHRLVLMALQVTLTTVYTFVGLTSDELLARLALSAGLTLLMRELTELLLKGLKSKRPTATPLLFAGLFLWICGLMLFYRTLGRTPDSVISYFSLGLSVSGMTICVTCLSELERQMANVARFGLDNRVAGYPQVRAAATEMAILAGQMIALVLLTILCIPAFFMENPDMYALVRDFRPLMILPPLLLLVAAAVSVLHFPMNHRYFQKLGRFLTLVEEGSGNPALEKQLNSVVRRRHKNRFGIKIIISLLRPLYYHKVIGKEHTAPYEEGSMILVCNHGELYGPVVTNLYVPISFRPWVISNMMDRQELVKHVYEGIMIRQKWLPEKWKKPLIRLLCPLCIWVFESLDGIPVYRHSPRELMKTFRLTVEAMQAGDNILLFPENGETAEPGTKGYAEEGVGSLYTGFAMLAPAYYSKTGKRAVFIPIYASKRLRTLTLGAGIEYDPTAPATQEKLRIVQALQESMQAMYEKELEEVGKGVEG